MPLNEPSTTVHYVEGEPSLALQALTSPRRPRPKELPPLRQPFRPSTSRSLGNEGKSLELLLNRY